MVTLTTLEDRVMDSLVLGMTVDEIATELHYSRAYIYVLLYHIRAKYGERTTFRAIARYVAERLPVAA